MKFAAVRFASILALALTLPVTAAQAQTYTEDFEGSFPAWESGWFGANTDALNFYCPSRGCSSRGNNPDGLWLQGVSGPGSAIEVNFLGGFGSNITSMSLGVAAFEPIMFEVFDFSGNSIFNQSVPVTDGAYTDPGSYANFSVASGNGISRFRFYNGPGSGYLSIDNVVVNKGTSVPEPSSFALAASGALALAFVARRRRNV